MTATNSAAQCKIHIGDRVQIGVGAVILADRDLVVGDDAQIGAGALVRESVAPRTTVTGCEDTALRLQCLSPHPAYFDGNRHPVIRPTLLHALSRWFYLRRVRVIPGILYRLNYLLNRCILVADIDIGRGASIARWVLLSFTDVGDGAILHPGVISARNVRRGRAVQRGFVKIGKEVEIEPGAIIVGADDMIIGDGARVEAGAVVTHSVPPGCTVGGVPARIITRPASQPAYD